jgi:glyoxylase-like metal-dependent hydrolase (beta-lactamase superfamily II)
MEELAAGVHRWTAPHPEWRPKAEEVESYALVADEALLLVDPLVPAEDDPRRAPLLAQLERMAEDAARVELLITIPYHTRSAEALYERFAPQRPTRIWGHANVRRRLLPETPLDVVPMSAAGSAAPIGGGAAEAYAIGRPRRSEHPLYVPSLRAAVFGDAVVGAEDGLRFWNQSSGTGADWYRDVFAPTLAGLAERPLEHVLVTHGPPVIGDGRRQLALCLAAPPVEMY